MHYPKGIKKTKDKNIYYGNRGMDLESDINNSNEYYRIIDKAIIYKKPIPIQINRVDYPSRYEAKIVEAYYKVPSTTDYNGIYRGKYIDFEAKETKNTNSFPLANIHEHQVKHIESIIRHGGIGFIIVSFSNLSKIFILKGEELINFIKTNKRKSIPIKYFIDNGYLLNYKFQPRIDYLEGIDELYKEKFKWKNIEFY